MRIKFKRDTSFRKQFFVPDSFAHPAKMDAQLLIWIVERYTKSGETILDPMAGSGTTMLACTLGRHCILVELEYKFCMMMWDNWYQVQMRPQLGSTMGSCKIIQGDARQLEGLCDKIITSPPFFNTNIKKRFKSRKELEEFAKKTKLYKEGRSLEAICRMIEKNWNADEGLVDKIVTSPPYAESNQETSQKKRDWEIGNSFGRQLFTRVDNPDNIGNLKGESYLEAMLQVYQQCYKVLKPEGLMILVTKNFIRNKQVIRLDEDTIKLCEQAGFSFVERHYRELPSQSFWRVIYHQKHPEVEQIKHEDVLVFKKCLN